MEFMYIEARRPQVYFSGPSHLALERGLDYSPTRNFSSRSGYLVNKLQDFTYLCFFSTSIKSACHHTKLFHMDSGG